MNDETGKEGGASVHMEDGRISKGLNLFWGTLAVIFVSVLGFCANNLWQLNLTIRDVLTENKTTVAELSDHELRLRVLERDSATWNGRNLRGGPQDEKRGK